MYGRSHGVVKRRKPEPTPAATRALRSIRWFLLLSLLVPISFDAVATAQPVVARVEPLGTFTTNAVQYGRDAGYSNRIGDHILWVFGDTFSGDPADPSAFLSATAGWSLPATPFFLVEAVDEQGAPIQFLPFFPLERQFQETRREPPACCLLHDGCPPDSRYCVCPPDTDCTSRIAIWPGDVIALGDRTGVVFYEELIAGVAPYDFRHLGTGLARVREGMTTAARMMNDRGDPILTFRNPEPNFFRAVAVEEEGVVLVYTYAAVGTEPCAADVLIARVPLDRVAERAAYRFWNGTGWAADLDAAAPILRSVAEKLGSVVWNDHLGAFVSGHSSLCTGGKFHVRSAPRPEGPWSEPRIVDLSALGVTSDSYAGMWHPALGTGRSMVMSYYQPLPEVVGEVRLARVTFE
jgi:hypothetical protein